MAHVFKPFQVRSLFSNIFYAPYRSYSGRPIVEGPHPPSIFVTQKWLYYFHLDTSQVIPLVVWRYLCVYPLSLNKASKDDLVFQLPLSCFNSNIFFAVCAFEFNCSLLWATINCHLNAKTYSKMAEFSQIIKHFCNKNLLKSYIILI